MYSFNDGPNDKTENVAIKSGGASSDESDKAKRRARQWRISGRVLLGLSLMPWLNLAVWTAFIEASRFVLGHYPHYAVESIPAPVDAVFAPLLKTAVWLLVLSVPVWSLWLIAQQNIRQARRISTVYLLGWATTILVCTIDPVGFVKWVMD